MKDIYFPVITEDEEKLPFFIKGVGIQRNQEAIDRPEGHPDFHWIHVTKGKGKLLLEGREHLVGENMGFFLYPSTPHAYHSIEEKWETHWITFGGYGVRKLLKQVGLEKNRVFYLQDMHLLEEHFLNIMRSSSEITSTNGFQTSVYLYQFLIILRNNISDNNRIKYSKLKQLDPVIEFLEQNYDKSPSLDEMAEIIAITPPHLCRLFKEVFKIRPFEYLTKIRIKKAKELMMVSDNLSIKYIAKKSGYNDVSYFCYVFKEYEGITPSEFKNIQRSQL